jgi:hypothetical protein
MRIQCSLGNQCQGREKEGRDKGKGVHALENPMLLKNKSTRQVGQQP